MAETSKNKIYYNDDENSVADVLTDMQKMAESADKAIENSKYNDTQIKADISNMKTEIDAKDTEQDNKIIRLETEKSNLETELKEMQEDFYQASVRGKASGEYIHVEDSSNCRAKINISGNSEQETREGYNLLDFKETNDAITKSGLNYKKNVDGSIEVSGTTNRDWDYAMANKYVFRAGKTYTVMANITGSETIPIFYIKFNTTNGGVKNVTNGSKTTITIKEDEELNLMWSPRVNTTVNFKAYILLYEGTEDKPYEQYGAMPSTDYPSEIKTVGDNINLLNNTLQSQSINGVDVEVKDGEIHLNGIATENFELVVGTLENISNMIISGMCDGYGFSKMMMQVQGKDYNVNVPNSNPVLLDELHSVANVRLYIYKSTNIENAVIKPKIEKGSTATPFSSYGQGSVKVTKCNKNRLVITSPVKQTSVGGIDITIEDNRITLNGTATGSIWPDFTYGIQSNVKIHDKCKYYFQEEKEDYIASIKVFNGTASGGTMIIRGNDDEFVDLAIGLTNLKPSKIGKINGVNVIYLSGINSGTKFDNFTFELQLEKGTKATDFVSHQEQSYIMPVQSEMLEDDYFDFDNEEEVHNWNKIESYNGETITTDHISTTGQLTIGATIYYKKETPTRLKFTDEQKSVAKELHNARTYKNVTNITTDSKAILDLDYVKDPETEQNKMQNEIDEIKQLLSTTQTSALLLDNLQKEVESEVE